MQIKEVKFISSNTDWKKCPPPDRPEYAFLGRSNVGKSSLINALLQHKNLAHVSSKPGKTQTINHFLVNNSWYLADMPGYGYAAVSKIKRKDFSTFSKEYLLQRTNLMSLFILIDIRVPPQVSDLEHINWAGSHNIPFSMVFTKCDKVNNHERKKCSLSWQKTLEPYWENLPQFFFTSSETKEGCKELLNYIETVNSRW